MSSWPDSPSGVSLWGFLTFDDRERANAFAAQVEAAGAASWLRLTEVLAEA